MKYFNMHQFFFSATAIRLKINNKPTQQIFTNLQKIGTIMDTIRQYIKKPIKITSGYRCPKLNDFVGGSVNSQHMKGLAVDFQVVGLSNIGLKDLFKQLSKGKIVQFDQLIFQYNSWIHISISDKPRHEVLVIGK